MPSRKIDVVASHELMVQIIALAEIHQFKASAPLATDSLFDGLDSPLGNDEVRQVLEVVTLIFDTGTSIAGFLAAVRVVISKSDTDEASSEVIVKDTETQKDIARIKPDSKIEDKNDKK